MLFVGRRELLLATLIPLFHDRTGGMLGSGVILALELQVRLLPLDCLLLLVLEARDKGVREVEKCLLNRHVKILFKAHILK